MSRLICSLVAVSMLVGCGGGNATPTAKTPQTSSASPSPPAAGGTVTPASATSETSPGSVVPASGTVGVTQQLTYQQALDLADQLIAKRDFNNAAKVLSGAIKAEPRSPQAYVKRAAILAEAKLLTQAIADMSVAIRLQPDNPKYLNTRGYFCLLKQDYVQAKQDFSDAIALDLNYPHPYNNRGLAFIAEKEFEKAIKEFELALKIDPKYIDAQNNLGFALLQVDRTEEAIEAFTRAIDLNGEYVNAINNRGRAYHKAGEYEQAVADFTRALEIQPDNLQYYLHRAEAYKAWGNEAQAAADLDHVAWVRGRDEFQRLLSANPQNADLWVGFGRHLAVKKMLDEAVRCYDQALKLVPEHPQAYLGRGIVRLAQKNPEDAIKDFTRAILAQPLLEAYSLRGDAHLQLGHLDEAIADYETAKRIDSQVVQAYLKRSQQHEQKGLVQLAKADQSRAEQLQEVIETREANGTAQPIAPRPFTAEARTADAAGDDGATAN